MAGLVSAASGCLFTIIIGLVWAANIATCFQSDKTSTTAPAPRPINRSDTLEVRLAQRLQALATATGGDSAIRIWMLDDNTVNAASFGSGRFVAWRGLAALPDSTLDAIFAHELGHDRLRHSKKAAELADVTNFVADVIATWSHSDEASARTIRRWTGKFVVPKYSRSQELQADSAAVVVLSQVGYQYPIAAVCEALLILRSRVGEVGGGLFASHPALTDRMRTLRAYASAPLEAESCSH